MGRDFAIELGTFLEKLPRDWPYGVEVRNKYFLHSDYFAMLKEHRVAHVFNSWADMPPVQEQFAFDGSRTCNNLCAARFLLKPGRTYEESVKLFDPYDQLKEPYPEARAAGALMIKEGVAAAPKRKTFLYVNNRLEGNALHTIAAMLEQANT